LQAFMLEAVRRFVDERKIASFDDLLVHGYEPTTRQRNAVTKQITRLKKPLTFQDAWTNNFVKNKYGKATTHWEKLMDRVERGVGNPCPLLLVGLPASMVRFDLAKIEVLPDAEETEADAVPTAPAPLV